MILNLIAPTCLLISIKLVQEMVYNLIFEENSPFTLRNVFRDTEIIHTIRIQDRIQVMLRYYLTKSKLKKTGILKYFSTWKNARIST